MRDREPEENVDEVSLRKQTAEHLHKIGNYLSSSCPPASRFYLFNLEKNLHDVPDLLKDRVKQFSPNCQYCGSIWSSENCRIRIQKRRPINRHLKKLINLEANEPWKLNNSQKKKLRKFCEFTNKTVYSCLVCHKKTMFDGTKKRKVCYSQMQSSNFSFSKLRIKKGDLNAGLFIKSPCVSKISMESSILKTSTELEIPVENKNTSKRNGSLTSENTNKISSPFCIKNKSGFLKNEATPPTIKVTPASTALSSEKKSASRKKKSLTQTLQEQSNIKKTSLASFLISI